MKVLIVTDKFYPKALANAICASNIAESFMNAGHQVRILAYQDSGIDIVTCYKTIPVYSVKPDVRLRLFYYSNNYPRRRGAKLARKLALFLNRSKKALLFYWNPLYSLSFPKRILCNMEYLYQKDRFDVIVSVYAQFENALSGMWFKKKHPECKWCLYALDTFEKQSHVFLPKFVRDTHFWLQRFIKIADLFLYMKSRQHEFDDRQFKLWKNKMKVTDIPLLTRKDDFCKAKNGKKEIWVYAGSLGAPHYKISDAIACFLELPQDRKREFHFYSGKGFEQERLRKLQEETNGRIVCHDFIGHDELVKVYQKADILVSVKSSNQISAKIFEYMAYGKRIVHFSGVGDDPNSDYVEKYSNGLVIRTYKYNLDTCVMQLNRKLEEWKSNIEGVVDLSVFQMNTPEYTRDLIVSYFRK